MPSKVHATPSPNSHSHGDSHSKYFCDGHSKGSETLFLPIFDESTWPVPLRIFLYLIGILFFFDGISHAVDVFMGAIEKITTHTIKVENKNGRPDQPKYREVTLWNETVATLTLGAAGTCSPEILLTIIEVVGKTNKIISYKRLKNLKCLILNFCILRSWI